MMLECFLYPLLNSVVICWVGASSTEINTGKGTSWTEWFSLTVYRSVYVVVMTAIVSCGLYNLVKNRLLKNGDGATDKHKCLVEKYPDVLSLKEPLSVDYLTNFLDARRDGGGDESADFSDGEGVLKQRLREAQDEIRSLRSQLNDTMDTRAELESTLALLDKEKISSEMRLELERVEGSLELEKLRKDNAAVRRDIQRLLGEKEEAEREAERLDREAKITRRAALDGEYLEERLKEAKKEAEMLQSRVSDLTSEKTKASSLLSDIPQLSETFLQRNGDSFDPDAWQDYYILDLDK